MAFSIKGMVTSALKNATNKAKKSYTSKTSSNTSGGSSSGYFNANTDYAAAIKNETDPAKKQQLMQERQNKLNAMNAAGTNTKGWTNDVYGNAGTSNGGTYGNASTPSSEPQTAAKGVYRRTEDKINQPTQTPTSAVQTAEAGQEKATDNPSVYEQALSIATPEQKLALQAYYARLKSNTDPTDIAGAYGGDSTMSLPDQARIVQYQKLYNDAKAAGNTAGMVNAHQMAEQVRDNYRYYPTKNSEGYGLGQNDIGYIRDLVVRTDEMGNKYVDQYNRNTVTTETYDKDGKFVNRHTSGDINKHNQRVAERMQSANERLSEQGKDNGTYAVRLADAADTGLSAAELMAKYGGSGNGQGLALYSEPMTGVVANGNTQATELYGYFDPNTDYSAAIAAESDPTRKAALMQERQNKINYLNATGQNVNNYTNNVYNQQTTPTTTTGTADGYVGLTKDEIYDNYNSIADTQKQAAQEQLNLLYKQIAAQQDEANSEYDNIARQAYINKRLSENALPQQLAALGISGGGSETANLRLQANYQNNLNDSETARQQALQELALQKLQAQADTNSQILGYQADAQNNAFSAWQNELSNQNAYNQWAKEYALNELQYKDNLSQNELSQQIQLAQLTGDYSKLAAMGYDTSYIKKLQEAELEQMALEALYTKAQTAKLNNSGSGGGTGGDSNSKKNDDDKSPDNKTNVIKNRTQDDSVYVAGYGWLTYPQLNAYVNNDSITETIIPEADDNGNLVNKHYYVAKR